MAGVSLIVAARTRANKPISTEDTQIAAIALDRQLNLATRNTILKTSKTLY